MAKGRGRRLAWYACAGATLLLFCYWALQVVFPPPNVKVCGARASVITRVRRHLKPPTVISQTTIGCGGVKFIGKDGLPIDQGSLRTEL